MRYISEHKYDCYLNQCQPPLKILLNCFPETPPKSNVVETTECYQGGGEGYRGTVDLVPTGLSCQRWDSQYPHNHTFIPQAYPCKWVRLSHKTRVRSHAHLHALIADYWMTFSVFSRDLRENYCRNPDGQESPWCFTMDPRVRTMFCTNIPQCGTQNKPSGERPNSFIWHIQKQQKKKEKQIFSTFWSAVIFCIFIFCGPWSSQETL